MYLLATLVSTALAAPSFDAGSDGSYGSLFVAAGTSLEVPLPLDGTIHATDIVVEAGATLTFTRNVNNTAVYLLSQGDVTIEGVIDIAGADSSASVGGAGGPGGFHGGNGTDTGNELARPLTLLHDADLLHLVGGRGGAGDGDGTPNCGGGGGGGAMLIASDTRITLDGTIDADGGNGQCPEFPTDTGGDGQAGHVRLVAPVVTGTGNVESSLGGEGASSFGFLRVDSLLPGYESLSFNGVTPLTTTFQVNTGHMMLAKLPETPSARIASVAGQVVATETGAVAVTIAAGSPTTQDVVVDVSGFAPDGLLNVQIERWQSTSSVVISSSTFTHFGTIDLGAGETSVTIPVDFEPLATTWLLARVY